MKKGELVFDYEHQEYLNGDGQFVEVAYESFPCPKCGSPADFTGFTAYYESYRCEAEDCQHSFTVS